MIFKKLNLKTQIILAIQSISMLGGASTHVWWTINYGFLSEKYNVPFYSMLFWDSLTFLDPIAAALLIIKPRMGVWLTAIIMIVDVFHNSILLLSAVAFMEIIIAPMHHWMWICQVVFLLFVLITFRSNMKEIHAKTKDKGLKLKDGSPKSTAASL